MVRTKTLLVELGLLTSLFLAAGGGAMHGYNGCYNADGLPELIDRCPQPIPQGASCVAYGILVTEQDLTGIVGDASNDWSESRAWTLPIDNPVPPKFPPRPNGQVVPGPFPDAPTDPQAHADAEQVGVTYNNFGLGLGLDTSTVFSRCDVAAVRTQEGFYTEAYGRAGAEDFELSMPGFGLAVNAEVLDFEIHAYGTPDMTYAFEACDIAQLGATPIPGFTVSYCPAPNTAFGAGPLFVELHEVWGPVPNAAGQWVYGGSALHLTLTTGASIVDVYVGYVAVAVAGGPPMPPAWVMDPLLGPGPVPCMPAPCQP